MTEVQKFSDRAEIYSRHHRTSSEAQIPATTPAVQFTATLDTSKSTPPTARRFSRDQVLDYNTNSTASRTNATDQRREAALTLNDPRPSPSRAQDDEEGKSSTALVSTLVSDRPAEGVTPAPFFVGKLECLVKMPV